MTDARHFVALVDDRDSVGFVRFAPALLLVLTPFVVTPNSARASSVREIVPVIRYGQTRRIFGVFRCSSLTIGLLCWSTQSSHGFLLSRHHQFTF